MPVKVKRVTYGQTFIVNEAKARRYLVALLVTTLRRMLDAAGNGILTCFIVYWWARGWL